MDVSENEQSGVDRRAALRAGSAAVVGLTVSALPTAAAAASGENAEPESAPEVTVPPPSESVASENEALQPPAPAPGPPVLSATATMSELVVNTDSTESGNTTYTYYAIDETAGGTTNWGIHTTAAVGTVSLTGRSESTINIRVEKRDGSNNVIGSSRVTITKQVRTVTPASGSVSLQIADADSGTRAVSVVVVGGRGGNGGNDLYQGNSYSGGEPANPGYVEATYDVPRNVTLVARAGSGGADGTSGTEAGQNTTETGGAGGTNGLSRSGATGTYDGGSGGNAGPTFWSGAGGGGGAASVLQVGAGTGTPLVVAAGSGGGGGAEAGEFWLADRAGKPGNAYSASNVNTGSTNGTVPQNRTGDRGGHGGGGGGFVGGAARTTDYSPGHGLGGYTGQSYSTASEGSIVRTAGGTLATASGRAAGLAGFVQLTYWTVAITQL